MGNKHEIFTSENAQRVAVGGLRGIAAAGVLWTGWNLTWYREGLSRMNMLPQLTQSARAEEISSQDAKFDAIAVLSPGMEYTSVYKNGVVVKKLSAGPTGTFRIDAAIYAVDAGLTDTVVMLGGQSDDKNESDAKLMEQLFYERARLFGVNVTKARIILEEKSKNTEENMRNLKEIAEENNLDKILLDTNDYHMFNSILLGIRDGDNVYPFIPEEELPKFNTLYAASMELFKKKGVYDGPVRKEDLRFIVMFFNQNLQLAENVWGGVKGSPVDIFISKITEQPQLAI